MPKNRSAGNKERDEEIKRVYLTKKLTMKQIGEQFGLSRQGIQRILKVLGVKTVSPSGREFCPKITVDAGELYQLHIVDRLPLNKVAAKLKVSRHVVDSELGRHGIQRQRRTYARWTWLEMDTLAIGDSFEAPVPDKRHADMKIYVAAYRRGIKISITRTSPDSVRVMRTK